MPNRSFLGCSTHRSSNEDVALRASPVTWRQKAFQGVVLFLPRSYRSAMNNTEGDVCPGFVEKQSATPRNKYSHETPYKLVGRQKYLKETSPRRDRAAGVVGETSPHVTPREQNYTEKVNTETLHLTFPPQPLFNPPLPKTAEMPPRIRCQGIYHRNG